MSRKKGKQRKRPTLSAALGKSPISYFSDLFVAAMVVAWIAVLTVMVAAAIYATLVLGETAMWSDVGAMAAMPLSTGGAIWMIKNTVQHAIRNSRGEVAPEDFPAVEGTEFTKEEGYEEQIDKP